MDKDTGRRPYIYILIFFILLYTFTMPGYISNIDTWIRISAAKKILENHTFGFREQELAGLGSQAAFHKAADGKFYSYHTIGQAIIYIPFYLLGKGSYSLFGKYIPSLNETDLIEFSCAFSSVLFCAFLVLLVAIFCSRLGYKKNTCILVSFLCGLATIVWPYSRASFNAIEEAFFILAACLLLINQRENNFPKRNYFFSGLLLGSAFLIRVSAILALPSLIFLILKSGLIKKDTRKKDASRKDATIRFLFFSFGLIPFCLLFILYNYLRYGSFFVSGYVSPNPPLPLFSFQNIPIGFLKLFFSPNYSFFVYSPVLLCIIFTFRDFISGHKRAAIAILGIIILYSLFYAGFIEPFGMWAYGARYIFILAPLGVIFLASLVSKWDKTSKYKKLIFASVTAISILVQIPAAAVSYRRFLIERIGIMKINEVEYLWNIKYSPQKAQFVNLLKAVENTRSPKRYSFKLENNAGAGELLSKAISLNVIDWWWVYAYIKGIKIALVIPLIIIFALAFSFYKLKEERR